MTSTLATSPAVTREPAAPVTVRDRFNDPAYQAFWLLRVGFTVAPILFGLDKYFHVLVNWDRYLAPVIVRQTPWTAHQIMYAVGAIEIVAGLVVALRPRFGGYLVAAWLAGIIVNLLLVPGFYDVALRDFGLFIAAVALARLATAFATTPRRGANARV
ncbi:MAG TPA: hypothetical protein VIK61_20420 [Acidimicrobiia bacterium]